MPLIAIIVGTLIAGWAVAAVLIEPLRLSVAAPQLQVGAAAGSATVRLFCAIVLILFVAEGAGQRRLHWVAGGVVVLGVASAGLGFLAPVTGIALDPNQSLALAMITLTVADALFAIGLVPATPPPFTRRAGIGIALVVGVPVLGVVLAGDRLPTLVHSGTWSGAATALLVDDLTPWYWIMISLPVALAFTAAVAAVARCATSDRMAGWLVLAMVVYAGAHLHHLLWPSAYQPVLTSANLLRSAAAAILAVGGLVELRRVAAERAVLLVAEKANSARMAELATLKAEFSAMVAHELNAPVAALCKLVDVLSTGDMDAERQAATIATLRPELKLLAELAADVTAAARDERDEFAVNPQPTSVAQLLAEAASAAKTLSGDHPVTIDAPRGVHVFADPVRIGQVLRNLLGNAAKYSPPGSPIALCAVAGAERIRIEVVDRGMGIEPADFDRIFHKFGRGRNAAGGRIPGVGLGLYLSRRIVRLHGTDLTVHSQPGVGSTFGFELEAVG